MEITEFQRMAAADVKSKVVALNTAIAAAQAQGLAVQVNSHEGLSLKQVEAISVRITKTAVL